MGSAGLFAAGTGLLELKGGDRDRIQGPGAVARGGGQARGEAAPERRLGADARRSPAPTRRSRRGCRACRSCCTSPTARDASGKTKFVIGIGEASVQAALNPSSTLSGAAAYGTASAALDGAPPERDRRLPHAARAAGRRRPQRRPDDRAARALPALADDAVRRRRRAPAAASNASGWCSACSSRPAEPREPRRAASSRRAQRTSSAR